MNHPPERPESQALPGEPEQPRPEGRVDGTQAAFARWSARHDGLDPRSSRWISGWVRLTDRCARALVRRRIGADAVTVAGVVLMVPVPFVAALGAAWPLAAVGLVVVAALLDGVDGAVASQTGQSGPWGRVLDALADRIADLLLIVLLVVAGTPLWLGAVLAALTLLLESTRATAQAAGLSGPGTVTVWERPSRVVTASFGAGLPALAWIAGVEAPWLPTAWSTAATALALIGLAQLTRAIYRQLKEKEEPAGK